MERIICLVIGYVFGVFQTAYIIGKTQGFDIRTKGSGNAGTTNAIRTLGIKLGAITLLGDLLKCIIAMTITWLIFRNIHPGMSYYFKVWTAIGVIIGHDFPFYMNFKGGKGIACTAGMIIGFGDLRLFLICAILFFGIFFTTHYVSLASLTGSMAFLIGVIVSGQMGCYGMESNMLMEMYIVLGVIVALAYYGHRGNISRLIHGNERKTYLSKKNKL